MIRTNDFCYKIQPTAILCLTRFVVLKNYNDIIGIFLRWARHCYFATCTSLSLSPIMEPFWAWSCRTDNNLAPIGWHTERAQCLISPQGIYCKQEKWILIKLISSLLPFEENKLKFLNVYSDVCVSHGFYHDLAESTLPESHGFYYGLAESTPPRGQTVKQWHRQFSLIVSSLIPTTKLILYIVYYFPPIARGALLKFFRQSLVILTNWPTN